MKTKRLAEGYLEIDHRNSPGIPDLPMNMGKGHFEAPALSCGHCQAIVIINPLRTRERAWCRACDSYICDLCGAALKASGVCRPFVQVIDETMNLADKGLPVPIFSRNPDG